MFLIVMGNIYKFLTFNIEWSLSTPCSTTKSGTFGVSIIRFRTDLRCSVLDMKDELVSATKSMIPHWWFNFNLNMDN